MFHSLPEAKGAAAKTLTLTKPAAVDLMPFELREYPQQMHLICL